MATFEIVSEREVTINGVGLLRAGEPKQLEKKDLDHFVVEQGCSITEAHFPPYVSVTVVVDENTKKDKGVK